MPSISHSPSSLFFLSLPHGAALFQPGSFSDPIAQIVKLGSTDNAVSFNLHLGDARRLQRELAFDPLAGHDAANDEHFPRAGAVAGDDHAAEDLDAWSSLATGGFK